MALDSALIFIANILAAFEVRPFEDENGQPIVRELEMSSGMLSYVAGPVPCSHVWILTEST
jgi:hypothetical protein